MADRGIEWVRVKRDEDESAMRQRIAALETGIREYLSEYDTPAKDYAYRAQCRERLRALIRSTL